MLFILLHIICFTNLLRKVSYSNHKNSYLFLKYIKRVYLAFGNSTQVFVAKYVSRELLDFVTLDKLAVQL